MKLVNFIIGMLIATAFIAGTTLFIGGMSTTTGIDTNTSYNATYDKIDELSELSEDVQSQLSENEVGTTQDSALEVLSLPMLKVLSFSTNSFSLIGQIIHDVAEGLLLPEWVIIFFITLMSFLLLFALFDAFFGSKV